MSQPNVNGFATLNIEYTPLAKRSIDDYIRSHPSVPSYVKGDTALFVDFQQMFYLALQLDGLRKNIDWDVENNTVRCPFPLDNHAKEVLSAGYATFDSVQLHPFLAFLFRLVRGVDIEKIVASFETVPVE